MQQRPLSAVSAHFCTLLVAWCIISCLPGAVVASPLRIDCQVFTAGYITRSIQLNNTAQVVTLAEFGGTAFFIDCFGYALQGDSCDGSGGGPPAVVEAWVLTTAVGTRKELSRHPLSGDLLGASILSTSYYYGASRYIYLQMKATSLPAGCSTVVVQYSFSAYSSVAQPPQYQGGGFSSPFFLSLSSLAAQTGSPVTISLGADGAAPQTFEFASLGLERTTCVGAKPSGRVSYARNNSSNTSMAWTTSFSASGLYEICMRPNPRAPFLYVGVLQIYATNPAFWDISNVYHSSGVPLNIPYLVTFVGNGFDLRSGQDTAKLASLTSRTCRMAPPAGGVPLGTSLMPFGAVNSQIAIFNFTLTIEGSYYFCYEHQSRWTRVPRFWPLGVNNRPLVPNVTESYGWDNDDEPMDWVSHSRTITHTIAINTAPPPSSTTTTGGPTHGPTTTTAAPPSTTMRFTTTAVPSTPTTTTSTPTSTAPTSTPAPTTAAPSTTPAPPSCDPLQLPAECPLLSNTHNALRLVLTVQYRVATFQSEMWRGNLSSVLCVPLEQVAIYEMADDGDSTTTASLVIGLLCSDNGGGIAVCSASELLSAVNCIASNVVITTDPVANATYQAQRDMLRASPLRILAVRDATSSITTANTTNHAAPSENPVLEPKDIAILSSTVAVVIAGLVAAVFAIIAYRKREFLRKQLGRLGAGEVFSTAIERIPHARGDVDDELDDDRNTGATAMGYPHAATTIPPREVDGSDGEETPGALRKEVSSSLNSSQHTMLDGVALAMHLDDQWRSQNKRNPLNQESGEPQWATRSAAFSSECADDEDSLNKPAKVVFEA